MLDIINAIKTATNLPVRAIESDKLEPQIIYEYSLNDSDGVIAIYNLRLNIVAKTLKDAEETNLKIRKALLSIGDIKKNNVLDIRLSGGGILKSELFTHSINYYTVKLKEVL